MNDTIIIVTSPDDINLDGKRILCFDLTNEQSMVISKCLQDTNVSDNIIVYNSKAFQDHDWLFDKKHKSDLIIFNAESEDTMIAGYLAAQKNSIYFGNLKSLSSCNKRAIYDIEGINSYLQKVID